MTLLKFNEFENKIEKILTNVYLDSVFFSKEPIEYQFKMLQKLSKLVFMETQKLGNEILQKSLKS